MLEEIKEKYPKAWNKFFPWLTNQETRLFKRNLQYLPDFEEEIKSIEIESLSGHLFKFFDKQGIIICIDAWISHNKYVYNWEMSIPEFNPNPFLYNSRPEVEQAAFIEAFKILETKLKEEYHE